MMNLLKFIYILKLIENLYIFLIDDKYILNLLSTFFIFISFRNLTSNRYIVTSEICIFLTKLGCIFVWKEYKDVVSIVDVAGQFIQILVQNELKCVDE